MGLSVLAGEATERLVAKISWGDYAPEETEEDVEERVGGPGGRFTPWVRCPRKESVTVDLDSVESGAATG